MWEQLGRLDIPLDLTLFTSAADSFYNSRQLSEEQFDSIHQALQHFTNRSDIAMQTLTILNSPICSLNAKSITLNAFRQYIPHYWYSLSPEDRLGIRTSLWEVLNQSVSSPSIPVRALGQALGAIAQHEYPQNWPTFIQDVLHACQTSPAHDAVFFSIIGDFSDDVVQFAEDTLTSAQAGTIVKALGEEIGAVIQVIGEKLESGDHGTILVSLTVLNALAHWIDPHYFLGTPLLVTAIERFLPNPEFTVLIIRIIGQVLTVSLIPEEYCEHLPVLFTTVIDALKPLVHDADMETVDPWIKNFFAEMLPSFIDQYSELVEIEQYAQYVLQSVEWTINTALSSDDETLSSIFDFLRSVTQRMWSGYAEDGFVVRLYTPVLPAIRHVLMVRVPSPFDFANLRDEDGLEARKLQNKQGFGDLYTTVKDALMYIARMDRRGTISQIEEMRQAVAADPSGLNSFCWAVGAIVPALSEQTERTFVSQIIEFLIRLCGDAPDAENRNVAASNVCFLCGQAAKFLLRDPELFVNVVRWMLSLLAENDPDLQNVAVECMKMLVRHNRDQMIESRPHQPSILEHVLGGIEETLSRLQKDAAVVLLDIISQLISALRDNARKPDMVQSIVVLLDGQFRAVLNSFDPFNPAKCQSLVFLLDCNRAIASHVGDIYIDYLIQVLPMLIETYSAMTQSIAQASSRSVPNFMSSVTDGIIFLIDRAIYNTALSEVVRERVVPVCLDQILEVFNQAPPPAKCPKVLTLFGSLSFRYPRAITDSADRIFGILYSPILSLVRENDSFESHGSLRPAFFDFLGSLIRSSIDLLLSLPGPELTNFVEGVEWGARHPVHEISQQCTGFLGEFVTNVQKKLREDQIPGFAAQIAVPMLIFALDLMTDTVHKFAITQQVYLLRVIVQVPTITDHSNEIMNAVCALFHSTSPVELTNFMTKLFATANNRARFTDVCKDFLVEVKHILPQDPDLRAAQKAQALEDAREAFKRVIEEQEQKNESEGFINH